MFRLHCLFCIFLFTGLCKAACNDGWFGSKCQYQCHCASGTCDGSGQCTSTCAPAWFGLGCQYQDLAALPGVTLSDIPHQNIDTSMLNDGDDSTCNTNEDLYILKISLPKEYPLTWIRFKVQDSNVRQEMYITFLDGNGENVYCNLLITVVDDTTVVYKCGVSKTIQHITVAGDGVTSLCSVSVSGGRNFALKQTATQTSTDNTYGADLAVDGNIDNDLTHGTCTLTNAEVNNVDWSLTLDAPTSVQRIVLYNRGDCCSDRLKNFKLETLDAANNVLSSYLDTSDTQLVYTVFSTQSNVSKIRVSPTYQPPMDGAYHLSLCEVQVYGECVPGTWGLECNQVCPQECSSWCNQDTGLCPKCNGFLKPPLCKADCYPGTWGFGCNSVCPQECSTSCDQDTGLC